MFVFTKLHHLLALIGLDVGKAFRFAFRLPKFVGDALQYRKQLKAASGFSVAIRNLKPLLFDSDANAGVVGGHYFCQDLWAARRIFLERPARHVDIGSRIDGFVAHVLVFMDVEVIDIRTLKSDVSGLHYTQADASRMAAVPSDSIPSLSCLHALEHFGLGRYGDPIVPDLWKQALSEMVRVVAVGGRLYLSVPVGRERLEFNAHRIYCPQTIVNQIGDALQLQRFCLVMDDGSFHEEVELDAANDQRFACGMFEFVKKNRASGNSSMVNAESAIGNG